MYNVIWGPIKRRCWCVLRGLHSWFSLLYFPFLRSTLIDHQRSRGILIQQSSLPFARFTYNISWIPASSFLQKHSRWSYAQLGKGFIRCRDSKSFITIQRYKGSHPKNRQDKTKSLSTGSWAGIGEGTRAGTSVGHSQGRPDNSA